MMIWIWNWQASAYDEVFTKQKEKFKMTTLNKIILCALFTLMMPLTVIAIEDVDLQQASEKTLKEFALVCKADAAEDEVEFDELANYLAICINDELESNGYQALRSEALDKLIKPLLKP
ncbi:hypothetical protein [Thalassotalea sediminis]|uniref:hypothetical protein n=1 Tax=Thalassotalea sediminis TaxID=1759089 RepID=UPI002573269E|nr:hypothetical protein [Thalassotalea sediminis]